MEAGTTTAGVNSSAPVQALAVAKMKSLGDLIQDAVQQGKQSLLLTEDVSDMRPIVLPRRFCLQGDPSLEKHVRVTCRCLRVEEPIRTRHRGKSEGAQVVLQNLRLVGGRGRSPLLFVGSRAQLRMDDCELQSETVGLQLLGTGSAATLSRVSITASETGVLAEAGSILHMEDCRLTGCGADGLSLELVREALLCGCYVAQNGCSGAVIGPSQREAAEGPAIFLKHNTICQNGQYGVFVNRGALVSWKANVLEGNKIGEKCGTGILDGWTGPCLPLGDPCLAWLEELGEWVDGFLVELTEEWISGGSSQAKVVIASSAISHKKGAKLGLRERKEILVPCKAIRPPRFTEANLPPLWSSHGPCRPKSAYQHFLLAQGVEKGDASTFARFKEATEECKAAEEAARKDKRRYDEEVFALNRAKAKAGQGEPRPALTRKRSLPAVLLSTAPATKKRFQSLPLLHPSEDKRSPDVGVEQHDSAAKERAKERMMVFTGVLERTRSGLTKEDLQRSSSGSGRIIVAKHSPAPSHTP